MAKLCSKSTTSTSQEGNMQTTEDKAVTETKMFLPMCRAGLKLQCDLFEQTI